jgi:3',5'-cyclic AMP phosphodiesterase CpdA
MKSLIISDPHHRVDWIDKIAAQENPDEVVVVGDYFDYFEDPIERARRAAQWVAKHAGIPGWILLLGNHDLNYLRLPQQNFWAECAGYVKDYRTVIDPIMTRQIWDKLGIVYETQGWVISHAGLHPDIFLHPYKGFDIKDVQEKCRKALENFKRGLWDPIMDDTPRNQNKGFPIGGPLWLRWHEFTPIPGVNQIVGHTRRDQPEWKNTEDSQNLCFDTMNLHYVVIEDGKVTIKENPLPIESKNHEYRNRWRKPVEVPA